MQRPQYNGTQTREKPLAAAPPLIPHKTQSNNTPTPTREQHQDAHTFHVEQAAKQTTHPKAKTTPRKKPVSLQPKKANSIKDTQRRLVPRKER